MIPGHKLVVHQEMHVAAAEHAVFMRSTTVAGEEPHIREVHENLATGLHVKITGVGDADHLRQCRCGHDGHLRLRTIGGTKPCAGTLFGNRPVIAHRIEDETGNGLALGDDAHHHAKQRQARREVVGAVDRIDHHGKIRIRKLAKQRGIRRNGLFTDEQRLRHDFLHAGADQPLSSLVSLGYEVYRLALYPDVALTQITEPRQDFHCRRLLKRIGERGDVEFDSHGRYPSI